MGKIQYNDNGTIRDILHIPYNRNLNNIIKDIQKVQYNDNGVIKDIFTDIIPVSIVAEVVKHVYLEDTIISNVTVSNNSISIASSSGQSVYCDILLKISDRFGNMFIRWNIPSNIKLRLNWSVYVNGNGHDNSTVLYFWNPSITISTVGSYPISKSGSQYYSDIPEWGFGYSSAVQIIGIASNGSNNTITFTINSIDIVDAVDTGKVLRNIPFTLSLV